MSARAASPDDDRTDRPDHEEVVAQLEVLLEENRRLRREYARARRTQYRRSALGLGLVGIVAVVAGVLFPEARTILLALGGTGVFAALLTYYLTPETVITANVGERVYGAYATNGASLVEDLGLAAERIYVPTGDVDEPVRLFVPQHAEYTLPEPDALRSVFVVTTDDQRRGVAFQPTGQTLLSEFEQALASELATEPGSLAAQLGDALVEQFELVDGVRVDDPDETRLTVGVSGSAYGPVDRFDHPVGSFLATGVAYARDTPVELSVEDGDDRSDYLVTIAW